MGSHSVCGELLPTCQVYLVESRTTALFTWAACSQWEEVSIAVLDSPLCKVGTGRDDRNTE